MTIKEIKSQLSILNLLSHYGLNPNKNGMLKCPFHSDQKASMKVYAETNTVYCFAGTCKVESLDTIDFIMQMEKTNKREAILKAKTLCGHINQPQLFNQPINTMNPKETPSDQFSRYIKSLHNHKLAKEYCEDRGLDWRILEVGYKSRKSSDRWGRGCIIFPLKNKAGNIVDLYGRGITGSSHFYQTNRKGLYPHYPKANTKKLILTESIIDAASLLQLDGLEKEFEVLALYGINGLTAEHEQAIKSLKKLEEIIFFLDGDEAGQSAVIEFSEKLRLLIPKVKFSNIEPLEGEDINSILQAHMPSIINDMVKNREVIPTKTNLSVNLTNPKEANQLDTRNPHNLVYNTTLANYNIKGGIRHSLKDLDSMKVTLVVENEHGKCSRNKLDMYEDKQIEKVSRIVAERLGLRVDLLEMDLFRLTKELEAYQEKLYRNGGEEKKETKKVVPLGEKEACLKLLSHNDLMEKLDKLLEVYGMIGERNNRRLGFCIVSSYGMPNPLHGLIQGSSGSGKTHLLSLLCSLIPQEVYIPITRATDNSFYNYQPYDLKNKLISIEDKDAMSDEASLAFRELQSNGKVSSSTTGQDQSGNSQSFIKTVYGPIASMACTTKGDLYLDDMNRCFLLAIDESAEQTKRVIAYQKKDAAGMIDKQKRKEIQALIQNCLRLLKSYEVVIPYAPNINLPEDVKDKRRLNGLYLSLVKQITLLHQFQRKQDGKGRLIATKKDLELANEIMFDAIVLKVDELHGPLRSFYEKLKNYLVQIAKEQKKNYEFRQREIRQRLRLSKSGVANYFKELLELEYIQIVSGSDRTGYQYKVSFWDDNEALRNRIQLFLQDQIKNLK